MNILSKIPADEINERAHITANGILFTLEQISTRYNLLFDLILRNEKKHKNNIVGLSWDVVDWINRLRILLINGAGIKQKEEWYKNAIATLSENKDIRDYIQHYEEKITDLLASERPALGYVSALIPVSEKEFKAQVYTAGSLLLTPHKEKVFGGFRMPKQVGPPLDHISLFIGNFSLNITELVDEIKVIDQEFHKYLIRKYNLSNQELQPTVKTPVESGNEQGTAAEL